MVYGREETCFVKEHSDSKKQVLWRWHRQDAWVSSWQYFRGFCRKSLPADSRHSNEYILCPSYRRHLSVFIRSGIHTVFVLNRKETVSISVHSHLQVHRWRVVHKQPRIRKIKYLGHMYPAELEIKDTTESITSASYIYLLLSIGSNGQLHTSITKNEMTSI